MQRIDVQIIQPASQRTHHQLGSRIISITLFTCYECRPKKGTTHQELAQ